MAKKLLSITVKGNNHEWSFTIIEDPRHLKKWRNDGLEINELMNIIPEWVVDFGLTKPWVFFQDSINFNNPFK